MSLGCNRANSQTKSELYWIVDQLFRSTVAQRITIDFISRLLNLSEVSRVREQKSLGLPRVSLSQVKALGRAAWD